MASRWTSPQFGDSDEDPNIEGDEREKANSVGKQEVVSREAAFVAAFEETSDVEEPPSTHLALVPYETDRQSAFEGFLAAVFSTLLALLLAWRFLAWKPEKVGLGSNRDEARSAGSSSSADSSDSSGEQWRWFRSKPGRVSSPDSSKSNSRKPRRKRRPFDERLAPKRRLHSSESENRDQLSPSLSETEDAPLSPSPVELEQDSTYGSRRNNVNVEWPSTADEDGGAHDFYTRPTMDSNFRRYPRSLCNGGVEDEYADSTPIRMISAPVALFADDHSNQKEQPPGSEKSVPEKILLNFTSSSRRPLVSPPPPPREPGVSLASALGFRTYIDAEMSDDESSTHFRHREDEDDDEDFLGSDLPPGFVGSVADEINRSTNLLLEELAEAEALLSSRQAPDIVRDLDTITEVSETDDLTSLSSNGGVIFNDDDSKSKNADAPQRWSRSSTAPCQASNRANVSECYRLAPTVTACSSSSETVNDDVGDEAYVDGDPFPPTPTPSFHDAQTGFSPERCRETKIDHVSTNAVIKTDDETDDDEAIGGKGEPCLPEENVNQSSHQPRRGPVAGDTTTRTTNAFVSEAEAEAETETGRADVASSFPRFEPHVLRRESASLGLVVEEAIEETGFVFIQENRVPKSSSIREKQPRLVSENEKNVARDSDNLSTPTSSGRTSIATDLPVDDSSTNEQENFLLDPKFASPEKESDSSGSHVEKLSAAFFEVDRINRSDDKLSNAEAEEASGEKTSSPSPVSNISFRSNDKDRPIIARKTTPSPTPAEIDEGKNNLLPSDQSSSSTTLSSAPRRERRFLLAYQQYHSLEREDLGESELSSSFSSSEPTKTTLLKQESSLLLLEENLVSKSETNSVIGVGGDDDDSAALITSSCMDRIDLRKALQRFARYGELYGDAPRSGMDEFRLNKQDEDINLLDQSAFDSLPNGSQAANKMEALLKSTLQNKGSPSLNGSGLGGGSSSTTKRDRAADDDLLSKHGGAVHALANVNGDYTTTGTTKIMATERHQNGGRQLHRAHLANEKNGTRYGGGVEEDSNKTKATPTSAFVSYKDVDDVADEFRSPSRPRRLGAERGPHDKNRFVVPSVSNGASATSAFVANSNETSIYVSKFKSTNLEGEKRNRPTSAPLTPLLINSPAASSGLGFGLGFDSSNEPVCVASATSQAIINDPDSTDSQSAFFGSRIQRKILAEASANAVASNPYIALARATTAAASKVAEASCENLLDEGLTGTVSLVVSSTVTTTKRDFFSTTKSTPDLLFFSSTDVFDVSGLQSRNRPNEMSYRQVTPTYGVIPRGTASIFQQRHRDLSPGRNNQGVRSPERKRQNYGDQNLSGAESKIRSTATTPARIYEEKKALFASSDHLQKLLEDPYYVKPQEKPEPPKRSPPRHDPVSPSSAKSQTTSTSTSTSEKEKAPPLSERNISDWNRRPENSLQNQKQQNLLRWRNSMNLAENEELRQALLEDEKKAKDAAANKTQQQRGDRESLDSSSYQGADSKMSSSIRATTPVVPELWDYKIFREEQKKVDVDVDEETKKSRRNKYKAKIDRAKKDYLTTKASASDLYRSIEDFEKKFNVSMENVRLPDPPRGPYLEYLSRSGHLHVLDVDELPPPNYVRPKPRFDREYESIVKKAEESWASYKRRLHAAAGKHGDELYARSRAYSTGVLETDVDDDTPYSRGQKSIVETDLDQVQREIEHESRKRTKPANNNNGGVVDTSSTNGRVNHSRAKSADYLMDQRARTEIEPPENQLQKILGEKDEKDLSEHELRFRKSTEKLQAPDWYVNSDYCPGGKAPSPDANKSRQSQQYPGERPKSTQSQYYNYGKGGNETRSSYAKSPTPTPTPTPAKREEDSSSRYTSPWVYGGRISGPQGVKPTPESNRREIESPKSSIRTTPKKSPDSPKLLPRNITEIVKPPEALRPEPRKAPIDQHKNQYQVSSTTSSVAKTAFSVSKSVTQTSVTVSKQRKPDLVLPKHFFDKYKDEIEELRKSRTALNASHVQDIDDEATWEEQQLKRLSAQGLPVPVATVRPTQLRDDDYDTTTSISFSPASSPESRPISRPGATIGQFGHPTPPSRTHQISKPSPAPRTTPASNASNRETPLNTSTPYSSDLLPRKSQPSKETAFEPYHHRQQQQPTTPKEQPPPTLHSHSAPQPPRPSTLERRPSLQSSQPPRHMPGGWTVSAVPSDWNVPGQRDSVVIEVAGDGLFESGSGAGNKGRRLPSHLTLDEILDSMLALPVGGKSALTTIDESSNSLLDDTQVLPTRPRTPTNLEGPGIYTQNQDLMDKCLLEPELASDLLKRETLLVKCGYCNRTREMDDARRRGFVSCHHCYTYYCNRVCRRADWDRHLDMCSYARINTLCKQVILKVRQDVESQFQMSRVAQRGYQGRGRGSVNFRFLTLTMAKNYVKDNGGGWRSLRSPPNDPGDFLHYYTVSDLVDARKDPSLITLCRRYDPRSKYVLSVSIMADIEDCPETPPPETDTESESNFSSNNNSQQGWYQRGVGGVPYISPGSRPPPLTDTERSWMTETRRPVHSNGHSKDDIYDYQPHFSRGDQHRHTVAAPQRPRQQDNNNGYYQNQGRPAMLIGPEDADETEV